MEHIQLQIAPFFAAAVLCGLAGVFYALRWRSKNPWCKEEELANGLSISERNFRENERRKLKNVLCATFTMTYLVVGLMLVLLNHQATGDEKVPWIMFMPVFGAAFIVILGIKYR